MQSEITKFGFTVVYLEPRQTFMTELFFCENGYRVLAVNYSRHKHFVIDVSQASTQTAITCLKLIKTLEQGMKYIQI